MFMILTKNILIRKKLVPLKDISLNSHKKIKVKCDNCNELHIS